MGSLALSGGQKALVKNFDKMMSESEKVVSVADQAYKLKRTKEGLEKPEGMEEEEFHIAADAMLPQKECPMYLRQHYARIDNAQRIAGAAHEGAVVPLIQFIQNNFTGPAYPVIDVTPEKKG